MKTYKWKAQKLNTDLGDKTYPNFKNMFIISLIKWEKEKKDEPAFIKVDRLQFLKKRNFIFLIQEMHVHYRKLGKHIA